MYCPHCGVQNPADALFCTSCGKAMTRAAAAAATGRFPAVEQLADIGSRLGAWLIDTVLTAIPSHPDLGLIPGIINIVMWHRGETLGMRIVYVRIMRENGNVSGFYHTAIRGVASILSILPLGLGFFWALWDSKRANVA